MKKDALQSFTIIGLFTRWRYQDASIQKTRISDRLQRARCGGPNDGHPPHQAYVFATSARCPASSAGAENMAMWSAPAIALTSATGQPAIIARW